MSYIGIDPGVAGGLAFIGESGIVVASRMPETDADLLELLREWGHSPRPFAVLEFVRSSPQMGVRSAFTFGRGYGAIRMALAAAAIPFAEVTPGKWQAAMGCRTKGDKHVTKRRAQELFPSVKVTNYVADALLLAAYCRIEHNQNNSWPLGYD